MSEFTTGDIQRLARKAGVNKPVLSVRVAGNRIELHLLGGEVVYLAHEVSDANAEPESSVLEQGAGAGTLATLTTRQLHKIASHLGMCGYSRLTKRELIRALKEGYPDERLQEAARAA
jgi:hypothetical protein